MIGLGARPNGITYGWGYRAHHNMKSTLDESHVYDLILLVCWYILNKVNGSVKFDFVLCWYILNEVNESVKPAGS